MEEHINRFCLFPGYINSKVVLYGYVKSDINETVSISINYNTFEVDYITGPEWLFNQIDIF